MKMLFVPFLAFGLAMPGSAWAQYDMLCREVSVEIPDDIRREVYCMRRGWPPPTLPPLPPPTPPASPMLPPGTSTNGNAFDRNGDGKLDCWKDAVGPSNGEGAGKHSKTLISSPYGHSQWRPDAWHYGLDLVSSTGNFGLGQPVRAISDGTIIRAETNDANGNFVEILHTDGRASSYLHLKELLRKDGAVRAGDIIGTMNCTGLCGQAGRRNTVQSTHVHIELKTLPGTARAKENRLDPAAYLPGCAQ